MSKHVGFGSSATGHWPQGFEGRMLHLAIGGWRVTTASAAALATKMNESDNSSIIAYLGTVMVCNLPHSGLVLKPTGCVPRGVAHHACDTLKKSAGPDEEHFPKGQRWTDHDRSASGRRVLSVLTYPKNPKDLKRHRWSKYCYRRRHFTG